MTIDRIPTRENFLFNVIEDNGEKRECVHLFTFEWEKTGRKYIVYMDGVDEDGVLLISENILDTEHGNMLYPVESKEELNMLAWKERKYWYEDEEESGQGR